MHAHLRQIRIAPKKTNVVAELVRKMQAIKAVDTLKFTGKKAALPLKKLIQSAMANAVNNFKQEKENLYIKEIIVTEGPTYKRSVSVSRGRVHPILKRTSHITVKLEVKEPVKTVKTKKATTEAETVETAQEAPSKTTKEKPAKTVKSTKVTKKSTNK